MRLPGFIRKALFKIGTKQAIKEVTGVLRDQIKKERKEMADETKPPKPGYQTTEFWAGLAAMLLTAAYASDAIPTGSVAEKIAAIAATILTTLGYSVVRGITKKKEGSK
jgi:lysophospholipid acyltransferase (LPLAT)-like uncharacterized protein